MLASKFMERRLCLLRVKKDTGQITLFGILRDLGCFSTYPESNELMNTIFISLCVVWRLLELAYR